MENKAFTLWLTGLPCSGKTTLASLLGARLRECNVSRLEILDEGVLRDDLGERLESSSAGGALSTTQTALVANLLARNGVAVIVADASPSRQERENARKIIGSFVEVYLKCALGVLRERDLCGSYYGEGGRGEASQAGAWGEIYEAPSNPEILVETDQLNPEQAAAEILRRLESLGLVSSPSGYSSEEEEMVKDRLEKLGYL